MGSIRISVPTESFSADVLSKIPEDARTSIRRGFSIAARLPAEKHSQLMVRAMEVLEEPTLGFGGPELQAEFGLSEQETETLFGAAVILASSVAAQEKGKVSEDVVAELAKAKLIESEDLPKVEALSALFKNNAAQVTGRLDRSRLATRIFPAFVRLHTATDVRVESGEKRLAVVVGLLHVHTDSRDTTVDFQISTPAVAKVIKQLQELQRKMQEAEALVSAWEKSQR